ncbi:fimbrial protein [Providencia rettgeri]|nr:fimbrial protein [Providencia rettgeri]ELL9156011.1 fimbrial protein [Providencia rettgeri]ELR5152499.1 fimbrial protein [Providencia rettgeri]
MKKLLISAGILSSLFACHTNASDGQINFTGTITDTACTVTNNTTSPLSVILGTVSSKAFIASGSTVAPTKFQIALTGCPDTMKTAAVKFDGISANSDNSVIKLTAGSGVAENVGVQIVDSTGKVVPLFTNSSAYNLTGGANNLQFVARYISLADTVKAGKADSTAQFTIVYN